jgi:hypothetical protein
VHLTNLVNHTRIEQDAFSGGGFASINVRGNADISYAF